MPKKKAKPAPKIRLDTRRPQEIDRTKAMLAQMEAQRRKFIHELRAAPCKKSRPTALCNRNCNRCPIVIHPNSRMVTLILNKARNRFGEEFYDIVQSLCPNLTVCYDCRIDDFCHTGDCELQGGCELEKEAQA